MGRFQNHGSDRLHWFRSLLVGIDGALGLMNQLVWGATFSSLADQETTVPDRPLKVCPCRNEVKKLANSIATRTLKL